MGARRIAFLNAELLDPELPVPSVGTLLVEGGRISGRLDPTERVPEGIKTVDLFGKALAPGFIDVHYHGELVFAESADLDAALVRAGERMLTAGTTAFLVTTVAWEAKRLAEFTTRLAELLASPPAGGARPIGLHLEGPWINPGAAGAQPAGGIRGFDPAEGAALLDRGEGLVGMVTLAPEVEGAPALLELLARRGVAAALGHSLAAAAEIDAAVEGGLRHVTHLFNAMGPVHHREPGVAGLALADDRLTCDLICDGAHVHPRIVRLAARALAERLMLITDRIELPEPGEGGAAAAAEFGSGQVRDDGVALRLPDGRLAGSSLSLDRALRNLCAFADTTLLEAVRACTLRPAALLGVERERGTLRNRARADLVVLDESGTVLETWIEGRRVYEVRSAASR